MHYPWSWTYTFLAIGFLLSAFLVLGAVLLLRHRPRAWHRTPGSISTPYGYISYSDIRTQKMLAPGVERARKRNYAARGKDL